MSKRDLESANARAERKRARKSRWGGSETEKAFIPGMPTILPGNLNSTQEKAYLLQLQIEEVSRRLRTGDLGINPNPEERSPSPEPIYNNEGKRLNTREYRTRKKLEEDRHSLIQEMIDVNSEYKPPMDYKPPIIRVSDKVMIPQDDHPEINFVGLLIGPRGNTLKSMEKETGAKIIIRGKGSVKEGKVGRKDGQPLPGEDEPLHAYVTAHNPESVKKAVDRIKDILRQGIEVPEGQNDLRRNQLRELALLNGTLRENEGPRCSNCGASTHRSWECPDKPNVTNNIICTSCGGAGHIAKDCRERRTGTLLSGAGISASNGDKAKIDEEYMSLMAELGEGPAPKSNSGPNTNASQVNVLSSNPGPIRALMAPPQVSMSQTTMNAAAPWQAPRHVVPTSAAPGVPSTMQGSFLAAPMPPPANAVGIMYPPWQQIAGGQTGQPAPNTSSPASTNITTPLMAGTATLLPPPPPPPPGSTALPSSQQQQASVVPPTSQMSSWSTPQPPVMAAGLMPPWQQPMVNASAAPTPVPPPRMAMPPASVASMPQAAMPHWQQFIGMPPPAGVMQPPIPGTVAPPPPPPPVVNAAATVAQGIDLNALAGLSGLLTAPPPPPPS